MGSRDHHGSQKTPVLSQPNLPRRCHAIHERTRHSCGYIANLARLNTFLHDQEPAPETLSIADDRVHPGHARKMVKAMVDEVPPEKGGGNDNVFYFENIEGGHGGAADAKQSAYVVALYQDFLFCALGGKSAGC